MLKFFDYKLRKFKKYLVGDKFFITFRGKISMAGLVNLYNFSTLLRFELIGDLISTLRVNTERGFRCGDK